MTCLPASDSHIPVKVAKSQQVVLNRVNPRMLRGQFPSVRVIQPPKAPFCIFFGHMYVLLRIWMCWFKKDKQNFKSHLSFFGSSYGDVWQMRNLKLSVMMNISGIKHIFKLALFPFTRNECFRMEAFFFFFFLEILCSLMFAGYWNISG